MQTTLGSYAITPLFGGRLCQLEGEVRFGPSGILYDKIFALITLDNQILDRHTCPNLVQLELELKKVTPKHTRKDHSIVFRSAVNNQKPITLKCNHTHKEEDKKVIFDGRMTYHVTDQGNRAAAWFTTAVGMDCRLVRLDDTSLPMVNIPGCGDFYTNFGGSSPVIGMSNNTLVSLYAELRPHKIGLLTASDFGINIRWIKLEAFGEERLIGKRIRFGNVTLLATGVIPCTETFNYMFDHREQRDGAEVKRILQNKFPLLHAGVSCVVVEQGSTVIRDKIRSR